MKSPGGLGSGGAQTSSEMDPVVAVRLRVP